MPFDLRIYVVHAIFWLSFMAGDFVARRRARSASATPPPAPAGAANDEPLRAPNARLLIFIHMIAFAFMYAGVGRAVFDLRAPAAPAWQRVLGALVILGGGVLVAFARIAFASWRFQAQLDAGHQLATGGPFGVIRHPIYAALDLLAIGTALWLPTLLTTIAVPAMVLAGELRARAEEPLLERAFGDEYRSYRRRTKRFIPGIY
jgi:protein-S-isoprenylcysteine O-methyltransferase Ste14